MLDHIKKRQQEINKGVSSSIGEDNIHQVFEKSGEGSRGGKVTGHTAAGKPIYGASSGAGKTPIKDHSQYVHGQTELQHSTSHGDAKYSNAETAKRAYHHQASQSPKGGTAYVKMHDGSHVVTSNKRASIFEKQGSGKVQSFQDMHKGEDDMTLEKAQSIAEEYFEKGGAKAVIGELRSFGGRQYIKTAEGWKFHGKGTGAKATEHVKGALGHHAPGHTKTPEEETAPVKPTVSAKAYLQSKSNSDAKVIQKKIEAGQTTKGLAKGKLYDIKFMSPIGNEVINLKEHSYLGKDAKDRHKFFGINPQNGTKEYHKVSEQQFKAQGYTVSESQQAEVKPEEVKKKVDVDVDFGSHLKGFDKKEYEGLNGPTTSYTKEDNGNVEVYDISSKDGKIFLSLNSKKIIQGESLADPTKKYLTTSAHKFTTKKKSLKQDYDDPEKAKAAFIKFISK